MGPAQIAVVWMMHDQQQAAGSAQRHSRRAARPAFTTRVGNWMRSVAYRAQLGPATGLGAV